MNVKLLLKFAIDMHYEQGNYNPHRQRRFGISAFKAGFCAAYNGLSASAYPYTDKRTRHGGVTFSRAYIRVWRNGWQSYHNLKYRIND